MNKDEIKQAMLKTMDDMNNRRFSKHTPGPWVASKAKWADGSWGAREGESKLIGGGLPMIVNLPCMDNRDCDIEIFARVEGLQDKEHIDDATRWSNAYLIAAAPEMFDALCKVVLAFYDKKESKAEELRAIREAFNASITALKKARGDYDHQR